MNKEAESKEVAIIPIEASVKQYTDGIEKSMADQMAATFAPIVAGVKQFEKRFNEIIEESKNGITDDLMVKAKRLRIDLSKTRTAFDKSRKKGNEKAKIETNARNGYSSIYTHAISGKEEILRDIEEHKLRIEEAKKDEMQTFRESEFLKYNGVVGNTDFRNMSAEVWDIVIKGVKDDFDRIQAAKEQAELDRLKKIEDDKKAAKELEKENAALKKEKAESDRKQKIKDDAAEADRIANEKKLKNEQINRERLQKIKDDKAKKEAADLAEKLKKEKAESDRKQKIIDDSAAEAKKKAEDEAAAKKVLAEERAAEEKAILLAPDKVKLLTFAEEISKIIIPKVVDPDAQKIIGEVEKRLQTTYADLKLKAEKL